MKLKSNKDNKKSKNNTEPDDMRTIADMNVPGMPWYSTPWSKVKRNSASNDKNNERVELTKGERKALLKAAFLAVLPIILIYAVGFTVIMLLLYFFWLHGTL
ncbi:MAG: hypothetical protein K0S55_922 [Clostridia bacterium]|nr:hypothetical protein [Clostridia bacterium]